MLREFGELSLAGYTHWKAAQRSTKHNVLSSPLRHALVPFWCAKTVRYFYGAPFVKILYLTDLAQKLLSLAELAISACRDVISARDSYLCMQR